MHSYPDRTILISADSSAQPRLLLFTQQIRRARSFKDGRRNNRFWALDYHLTDAGEYSLDGKIWRRRVRHTAHLYAPGTAYWERCIAEDLPFPETYFVFNVDEAGDLEKLVSAGQGFARFTDEHEILREQLRPLLVQPAYDGEKEWRAQGVLYLILDRLMAAQPLTGWDFIIARRHTGGGETLASRVDAFLLEHSHENVNLAEVAESVGVSRSTLSHEYRRMTGTTPAQRLRECRLQAARSMILKGERLKIVASRTGFCDEYHLSRAFKSHFGKSPRHFLQDVRDHSGFTQNSTSAIRGR